MCWRTFIRSHADVIAGADFFTSEVWTARGLLTHYVLFVIDHATRAVVGEIKVFNIGQCGINILGGFFDHLLADIDPLHIPAGRLKSSRDNAGPTTHLKPFTL